MFLNPFQPELRGILTRFHKLFAFLRCEVRPFFVRFALGTQPEMDTHLSDDSVSKSYQREGQPRKTENEFSHDCLTMIHRESHDPGTEIQDGCLLSLLTYKREGQPRKTENEFNHDCLTMIHRESHDPGTEIQDGCLLCLNRC